MSLQGYATAVNQVNEVIAAYAAAPYEPTPVPDPSPWVVMGSFSVPIAVSGRLAVQGLNTGPAVLSVALFDPALLEASTTAVTSSREQLSVSQSIDLAPNTIYQIAVKFEGASGFGVVRTVSLVSL